MMGQNLAAVHESDRELIKQHFANIRQQRLDWLDDEWIPKFLGKFLVKGRLVDVATGKTVFDRDAAKFVDPTPGREKAQLLDSVQAWTEEAMIQIDKKRKEIVEPVDNDEKELLASVDEAFARLFRGNAAITAHLNSLRKVQGAQDDILKALDLKDLRQQINEQLAKASDKAKLTSGEVDRLQKELDGKVVPAIGKVKDKLHIE